MKSYIKINRFPTLRKNLNLSVQSRKSPVFQFDFFGTLNFSDPKTPTQSLLYQNNLSNRTNQPGCKESFTKAK